MMYDLSVIRPTLTPELLNTDGELTEELLDMLACYVVNECEVLVGKKTPDESLVKSIATGAQFMIGRYPQAGTTTRLMTLLHKYVKARGPRG